MIYYNVKFDIIAELSYDIKYDIILMKISEDKEYIAFTDDWERIGTL